MKNFEDIDRIMQRLLEEFADKCEEWAGKLEGESARSHMKRLHEIACSGVDKEYGKGFLTGRVLGSILASMPTGSHLETYSRNGAGVMELQLTNDAGKSIYVGVKVDDDMETHLLMRPM